MLVLTRKIQERVRITYPGGEIWVQVTGILGNKVRLGFAADRSVQIDREEVLTQAAPPRPPEEQS